MIKIFLEGVSRHTDDREVIRNIQHDTLQKMVNCAQLDRWPPAMEWLVDKKKTTDGICLDFCKAFNTVSHNMLVTKSLRQVLRGQTT